MSSKDETTQRWARALRGEEVTCVDSGLSRLAPA